MHIGDNWGTFDVGTRNDTVDNENVDESESLPIPVYVVITFFAIILIKQNIYLIIAFRKREFYELNMFYCVVHWSFANILHSILPIYLAYVPKGYRSETLTSAFLAAHSIVSAFTLTIAACFVFDKFINSKDFCRRMIRSGWLLVIVCLAVVLPLVGTAILEETWIGYVYIAYSSISLIIFILRLFYGCSTRDEEETHRLRVLMSGVFIFSSYIFTGWWITYLIDSDMDFVILVLSVFVIVCNGFINAALMFAFQPQFRPIFSRLMTRCLMPCARNREDGAPPKNEDVNEQPNMNRETVNHKDM